MPLPRISRQTFYKWLRRYQNEGLAGPSGGSRARHHCPERYSRRHRQQDLLSTAELSFRHARSHQDQPIAINREPPQRA
ncbi:helix-turn-helix domain-containing protein [Actinoplanes sp. NPDC051343]|uniref:helix-turn-helix domain-containing protein n=1 Tax=Actinoplanes sp. NPDC051343 TaxID=3363906 RepID=UPI0037B4D3B1